MTSGIVTWNWPIAGRCVPSNYPRNNCGHISVPVPFSIFKCRIKKPSQAISFYNLVSRAYPFEYYGRNVGLKLTLSTQATKKKDHSTVKRSTTTNGFSSGLVKTITGGASILNSTRLPRFDIGSTPMSSSQPREAWFHLKKEATNSKNEPQIIGPAAK